MSSRRATEALKLGVPDDAPNARSGAGTGPSAISGGLSRRLSTGPLLRPKAAVLVILFCTAVALVLRLYNLDGRPFWVDEAGTWGYASLDASSLVGVMGRVEPTPPSYYLLMKAWMALGDGSEFWLRLSSVVVSAVSVPLFAAFLWRAFGPVAAVWGAALLAVAGAHVRYAQEARVYSTVFMLFVLGLLLMERLVHALETAAPRRRRWGFAIALGATSGLMIYMHFSAALAAATIYFYGLCLLVARKRVSVRRVAALVASGVVGLVLAAPVVPLAVGIAASGENAITWVGVPDLARAFFEFQSVLLAPHLHRLALPGAVLSLVALGAAFWAGRRHPQVMALTVAFAFAVCSFYAVSHVTPILLGRTVLFTLALTLAVLACGLSLMGRRFWLVAAVAALAFLPQVKGTLNQIASGDFYGEVWPDVARRMNRDAAPQDTIMLVGSFETVALDYYLAREGDRRSDAAVGDRDGGVNTLAISLMTRAVPVNVAELTGPICKALRPGGDIWLISRDAGTYGNYVASAQRGLEASGSAKQSRSMHGSLFVERWSPPSRCG